MPPETPLLDTVSSPADTRSLSVPQLRQLADELRADRPDLKVLFTSGYTQFATNGGHASPKGLLLSKPYRKHDLGLEIRATLDERLVAVG